MTGSTHTEAEFHASRRMFAIIDNQPILAEEETTESHAEWFIRMGWITSRHDSAFETIVRGYSDGQNLYAYRGKKFLDDEPVETVMKQHAKSLRKMFNLPESANLLLGSVSQEAGFQWPARRSLGPIATL